MATPAKRALRIHKASRPPQGPEPPAGWPSRPAPALRPPKAVVALTPAALIHELSSCVTEADIVQVLYRGLQPLFGYDVVALNGLEREGWTRAQAAASGVLQNIVRRPLAESFFRPQWERPRTTVIPLKVDPARFEHVKGPGAGRAPRFVIWVPVEHRGELIGAMLYQSHRSRRVPASEIAYLDEVHRRLGVLVANASLNELTRNQARRLGALNSIARAMASTLDEA